MKKEKSMGGSYVIQKRGSSEELGLLDQQKVVMDERKRKRMISNRESARRSRMRKQKHMDDLISQLAHLRRDNSQIFSAMNATTQHYLRVEEENSVLRAQLSELTHRLESLNEIIGLVCGGGDDDDGNGGLGLGLGYFGGEIDGFVMNNSWINYGYVNNQPIMPSMDVLQY